MDNKDLGFSFDMTSVDRQALLDEAATRLDERRGDLGGETKEGAVTPEGNLVRALKDDVAEFAAFPEIHKITDEDFLASNLKNIPVRFSQLSQEYNFYWLRFPLKLFPRHKWAFDRIELFVEFNPGDQAAHQRPKAYQILPKREFQKLLELSDHLELKLDENFEFSAKTGKLSGKAGEASGTLDAGVETVAKGGLGLVVGPFTYRLKKAKIQHTDTGTESVFWRIDGAEFFQEDSPQFVIVAQVPKGVNELKVHAELLAYRYFSFAEAGLREAIKNLPTAIRTYFEGGLPVGDRTEEPWDLTSDL